MTTELQLPVSARLAALAPAEVDSQVASSVRQCGVDLRDNTKHMWAYEKPDGTKVPAKTTYGFSASASCVSDVEAAKRRLSHAMTPPTADQATGWLAELSVITARRMDDDTTEDFRAAAYSRRLAEYPADIARHSLLVHRWKFFPTWAELADVCDELMEPRRKIQQALEWAEREARDIELKARALPSEETVTLTPEEAAARKAETDLMLANLLGSLKAMSAQEEADDDARAKAAAASYERFRQPPAPDAAE